MGVTKSARPSVITSAYRALVREMHPDTGGDAAEFRAVREAWEILNDPVRRASWEAAHPDPTQQQPGEGAASDEGFHQSGPKPREYRRPEYDRSEDPIHAPDDSEPTLRDVRAAVTLDLDLEAVEVDLEIDRVGDLNLSAVRAEVDSKRAAAKAAEREATEVVTKAAQELADQGIPLRDIGTAFGISHQRVDQLIKATRS